MKRWRVVPTLLAVLLLRISALSAQEGATTESLDSARATLAKWVETREIISREKKEWEQARETLTARIEVLGKEVGLAEENLRKSGDQRRETEQARKELQAQTADVQAIRAHLGDQVGELESKVRRLFRYVPESMKEKLAVLYQRMPEDPATAKVSVAERFQNVLGVLNELNRIQSEISVVTEIRALSDGRPSEVKTVYVGLGQAYYVSARGEAGTGRPGGEGWIWRADDRLARDINQVLEIVQNKSSPHFVPLPVEVK